MRYGLGTILASFFMLMPVALCSAVEGVPSDSEMSASATSPESVALIQEEKDTATSSDSSPNAPGEGQKEEKPELPCSLQDVQERYNTKAPQLNLPEAKADQLRKVSGETDRYTLPLTDYTSLVLLAKPESGKLVSLTFNGLEDGTKLSHAVVYASLVNILSAVIPDMERNQKLELLRQLGFIGMDWDGLTRNKQYGDLHFAMKTDPIMGITMAITPALTAEEKDKPMTFSGPSEPSL